MNRLQIFLSATIWCTALSAAANASELTIALKTTNGQPMAGAVVTVHPAAGVGSLQIDPEASYSVEQEDIEFKPHISVAPVGVSVDFPNRDKVRHHVYSFSKGNKFQIKLYGRDESHSITFDKPGVVALGCNIHDEMSGYIKVVDTPYALKSDETGTVKFSLSVDGDATLTVWHPHLKTKKNQYQQQISLSADSNQTETITLDFLQPMASM